MPFTITVAQLLESAEALRFIFGVNKATEKSRYTFKAKAKLILSKRLRTVTGMTDEIEAHRKEMLKEFNLTGGVDKEGKPTDEIPKIMEFNKAWAAYTLEEIIVECGPVDAELLDLETNDIPISHLSVLDWLLTMNESTGEAPAAKAAAAGH